MYEYSIFWTIAWIFVGFIIGWFVGENKLDRVNIKNNTVSCDNCRREVTFTHGWNFDNEKDVPYRKCDCGKFVTNPIYKK